MEDSAHTYSYMLIGVAIGLLIGTCAGYFVGTWQMMQGFEFLQESTPSPAPAPVSASTTVPSADSGNPLQNVRINPFN